MISDKQSNKFIPTTNEELAVQPTVYRDGLLDGNLVVVSGGGSGIGKATAWLMARLGARVVITGRSEEKLNAVAGAINAAGLNASPWVLDIREREQVFETFARLNAEFGVPNHLINSAGGQFPQQAIDFSAKGWNTVINTNLNGTWHMMQAAAHLWRDTQQGGCITNIVVVPQGLFGVAHTCAARAGVIALSESVAVEWAPLEIRINCIAPGAIKTEGWAVYDAATSAKYPKTNPLMRAGSSWEIAEACVFLGSPSGDFITGEVLTIDGGGQHWGEIWSAGKPEYFSAATRLWDEDNL